MLHIDEVGTVSERILQLVDHFHQGNKTAFGRAANIQSGVLAGIVGGRESKPGFEILQKLLTAYPTVSPTWLLFGRGEMLTQAIAEPEEEDEPELPVAPDGTIKLGGLSFLPSNYKPDKNRWNQYYRDRAQHERMGSIVSSLVEYLAKRDDSAELRSILEMLPVALKSPLDPNEEDALWDEERDRLNDEYNAQQSAEWRRQAQERQEREGKQEGQQ